MTSSHVHDDDGRLVKGRAFGYSGAVGALRLDASTAERVGAGGVYSTIRDLIKWDENFYTGKVGGRGLIDQVQTPGSLSDGKPLTYAWGLQIGRYRGLPIVEHGGSLVGYRAHLMRFADKHISIACLCNHAGIAPGNLARRVADIVIGADLTGPAPAGAAPTVTTLPTRTEGTSTAGWSSYVGRFYAEEIDSTFTITLKGDALFVQRETDPAPLVLQTLGADRFQFRAMTLRFTRGAGGGVDVLTVDAGRVRGIRFDRRKS